MRQASAGPKLDKLFAMRSGFNSQISFNATLNNPVFTEREPIGIESFLMNFLTNYIHGLVLTSHCRDKSVEGQRITIHCSLITVL